ncbi:unnamed protein product [Heligmosomoides polygyrus]|uniref:G_PROTEIN_RECEP_F1_2 domain-containing protein n=1 Tax=Heligmosomoides polygyrus TaxID=6339 RepID=A0A183G2X2_HELPZ|nr:unnamed protein product [Heligmosomoides polygyrus]
MNLSDWSVSAYVVTPGSTTPSSMIPTTTTPLEMATSLVAQVLTSSSMPSPSTNDDDIRVIMLNNTAQPGISIANLTMEETCRFRGTTENYVVIITFITIFLLSVIGNALVIVVIMQQRAMRSITNIYLMNLAITDLMLSVVCMPPTLFSMVMNCWIFGNILCKVFAYLQPMVVTASAYTLAVIAFERYYAICRPLHSRIWQTRSHAYAMIMLVWVVALAANVLMLFMYEEQTYNGNGLTCTPIYEPVYHFANQVYMTIVLLAVPLVTMTVLYGSVIKTLKVGIRLEISAVDSVDQENSTDDSTVVKQKMSFFQKITAKLRKDKKASALKARESAILKRSEIPPMESSLRSTHIQKSAIAKQRVIKWSLELSVWNSDLNTFITLLTYISSCTNPITYCFLNKKFRTAIYAMFGRKKVLRHHFQKVRASHSPLATDQ